MHPRRILCRFSINRAIDRPYAIRGTRQYIWSVMLNVIPVGEIRVVTRKTEEKEMENTRTESTRNKVELALWALGSLVAVVYTYAI